MSQISSWTTYYQSGAHNGFSANITIPSMAISGTVVAPGQWFSYWKTVGEVSLAKGYKLGGAIIDGHSVEGKTIGGGICSTSTTLFNAALRAGFHMGARKNHYYYIARYPKGLDATVFISGSVQDMTWTNNSPYPVLIKAHGNAGCRHLHAVQRPDRPQGHAHDADREELPAEHDHRPAHDAPARRGRHSRSSTRRPGSTRGSRATFRDASGKIIHTDTFYSHYGRVVGRHPAWALQNRLGIPGRMLSS